MVKHFLLIIIRGYQRFISPFTAPRCRFHPTCSQYAIEALQQQGARKGSWLALKRLLKCHPLHPGGIDLVPEAKAKPKQRDAND